MLVLRRPRVWCAAEEMLEEDVMGDARRLSRSVVRGALALVTVLVMSAAGVAVAAPGVAAVSHPGSWAARSADGGIAERAARGDAAGPAIRAALSGVSCQG